MHIIPSRPLMHSLIVILGAAALAFYMLPTRLVNEAFDCFAISTSITVMIRYAPQTIKGISARHPANWQTLLVSVAVIAFGVGSLRLLRSIGLDLGLIQSHTVAVIFGLITATMIWALALEAVVPPLGERQLMLSPWAGVVLIVVGGGLLFAIVKPTKWYLGIPLPVSSP